MTPQTASTEQTTSGSATPNPSMEQLLNELLADYQILYQKLRAYHWLVEGEEFFRLHEQFEQLYTAVSDRVDEVAERIRARNGRPLTTYAEQLSVSRIEEDDSHPEGRAMVQHIHDDFETINQHLRTLINRVEEQDDPATADLLTQFLQEQEKTNWMLQSFLR